MVVFGSQVVALLAVGIASVWLSVDDTVGGSVWVLMSVFFGVALVGACRLGSGAGAGGSAGGVVLGSLGVR